MSDVIVFITGGKFGSESSEEPGYSISQVELKRALAKGLQVFIFAEKNVLHEYNTYKLNKESNAVKYSSVNDVRVFHFIDELFSLPRNNPITGFEIAADITDFLKDQLAGLFHRFLQDQKRIKELDLLEEMNSVATTLKELVGFLTDERKSQDDAIKGVLLANHPAFRRLRTVTRTPYRVFFATKAEMTKWLNARSWIISDPDLWDVDSVEEWALKESTDYIKFTNNIFDESDKLQPFSEVDWNDDWIQRVTGSDRDDIPF